MTTFTRIKKLGITLGVGIATAVGTVVGGGSFGGSAGAMDIEPMAYQSPLAIKGSIEQLTGVPTTNIRWAIIHGNGNVDLQLARYEPGVGWDRTSTPNPGTSYKIVDVAVNKSNGWAVATTPKGTAPYLIHWNGTRWNQVNPAGMELNNTCKLLGVSAPRVSNVWVRGRCGSKEKVWRWGGSSWKSVLTTGDQGNLTLYDTIGTGAKEGWISAYNWVTHTYVVKHWTGSQWVSTAIPDRGLKVGSFTASSPSDIRATVVAYPLKTIHWNGSKWTTEVLPGDRFEAPATDPPTIDSTTGGAWLVSNAEKVNSDTKPPYIARIMGPGLLWSLVKTPNVCDSGNHNLLGVDADTQIGTIVVGSCGTRGGTQYTLAMRWDGDHWSRV